MKILQMVQTLDPSAGGVARAVTTLSHALVRLGNEVEVLTLDEPGSSWLENIQLRVYALGAGLTNYRYSKHLLPWLRAHGGDYDCAIVTRNLAVPEFRGLASIRWDVDSVLRFSSWHA